jgi:hypothetical protein
MGETSDNIDIFWSIATVKRKFTDIDSSSGLFNSLVFTYNEYRILKRLIK